VTQPAESFIPVSPSVDTTAPKVRQLLVFEFQPATQTYVQVQTEVVALADPLTGLTVRAASEESLDSIALLLRANLRALTAIANELGGRERSYDVDEFYTDAQED